MPGSAWIQRFTAKDGSPRYRVRFRTGGRESGILYGGSFKLHRLARVRRDYIAGELAARRMPDLGSRIEPPRQPTFAEAAKAWQESRLDIVDSTREQHRIQLDKLLPLIGTRRVDELTGGDFAGVKTLHEQGTARETIRKTLGAGAMKLDHAGVAPNLARDRSIKLPPDDSEELSPPSAAHVEAVFRRIPAGHRLALLFLDWSGARVSAIDKTLVGDYDEPRRRVRLRKRTTKKRRALWIDLPPVLAEAIEATLPHRRFRDHEARLFADSGVDALRTRDREGVQGRGRAAVEPARPPPSQDQPAAPARRAVGSHRRVRRTAKPLGDRGHV